MSSHLDLLRPLTPKEIELAVSILRKEKNLDEHYKFTTVSDTIVAHNASLTDSIS